MPPTTETSICCSEHLPPLIRAHNQRDLACDFKVLVLFLQIKKAFLSDYKEYSSKKIKYKHIIRIILLIPWFIFGSILKIWTWRLYKAVVLWKQKTTTDNLFKIEKSLKKKRVSSTFLISLISQSFLSVFFFSFNFKRMVAQRPQVSLRWIL